MSRSKRFFVGLLKSKTFWLNVVGGALSVVNAVEGELIPPETAVSIVAGLNIVNRMLTSKPLTEK